VKVNYSKHVNLVSRDCKEHAVWDPAEQRASDLTVHGGKLQGRLADPSDHSVK
jgi:small nuclear ribonucleoprotein (snRNP)-like protein